MNLETQLRKCRSSEEDSRRIYLFPPPRTPPVNRKAEEEDVDPQGRTSDAFRIDVSGLEELMTRMGHERFKQGKLPRSRKLKMAGT